MIRSRRDRCVADRAPTWHGQRVRVQLLYFAVVADLMGRDREDVDLPASVTNVGQLAAWVETSRPPHGGRLSGVRFAVDESFADAHDPLHEGAVVALIPPVAGG